ncbi:MAG: diaminopimelate epimerase [Bacteroidales bacterium]|nr:diaminopimelate epimerase [Bacteroidales bacterium]MBR4716100.1 diaminopimelate epimerase [Bacteroidales bacterium]
MYKMPFYKFDGAGNDFVVIDNRCGEYHLGEREVARICHRRFGVGADGMMTLEAAPQGYDFEMRYYNSDGRLGSMCGNGGRCIAAFAHSLGLGEKFHFLGYDGPHDAEIMEWDKKRMAGVVKLGMHSVTAADVKKVGNGWFLDTGSPHYVQYVEDLEHYDVVGEGRRMRNRADLFPEGTNVDFIEELADGRLAIRTYERGVEDETWACGTGVTASAIVSGHHRLKARGGDFSVDFDATAAAFENVKLIGPVALNFTGEWTFSVQ